MNRQEILQVLPMWMRQESYIQTLDFQQVQEIRLRVGQVVMIHSNKKEYYNKDKNKRIRQCDIREIMEYISRYSLFAYESEMRNGYITIEGGHRVGIAGKVIVEGNKVKNFQYISSVNIRISHEIIGCAEQILPYIRKGNRWIHTLVISPPGCGKTTLLRDMVRIISDGDVRISGRTVGVVDERSEIGGCYEGVPQNNLGRRTDILDACPKAEGMVMLIRSMAPEVLVVDEIGTCEDGEAIRYAIGCGCVMIASVHGSSLEEVRNNPYIGGLVKEQEFQRYVLLENGEQVGRVKAVYDGNDVVLYEGGRERYSDEHRNVYGGII